MKVKVKVSEAAGSVLDWMVAKALGKEVVRWAGLIHLKDDTNLERVPVWSPSTDWSQGGPIIEGQHIELKYLGYDRPPYWGALKFSPSKYERAAQIGPTALVAAMRCFVYSRLGDEVDVPEELR